MNCHASQTLWFQIVKIVSHYFSILWSQGNSGLLSSASQKFENEKKKEKENFLTQEVLLKFVVFGQTPYRKLITSNFINWETGPPLLNQWQTKLFRIKFKKIILFLQSKLILLISNKDIFSANLRLNSTFYYKTLLFLYRWFFFHLGDENLVIEYN